MGGGTDFLLNEKDPFAFGPGARPWTTLLPYLVERNGRFWMAAAVKGGDRQPYAFTQCLVNMVERGLDGGDAIARPRFRDASHAGKQVIEWDRPPYIASNQLPGGSNSTAYELAKKLSALGYPGRMHKPSRIEDSGFGVAQILVDNTAQELRDAQSILLATEILAISDLARPGARRLPGHAGEVGRTSLRRRDHGRYTRFQGHRPPPAPLLVRAFAGAVSARDGCNRPERLSQGGQVP